MTNKELLEWYATSPKPVNMPVQISPGVKIIDLEGFLDNHLRYLKSQGENTTSPVALRLRWLKEAIDKGA